MGGGAEILKILASPCSILITWTPTRTQTCFAPVRRQEDVSKQLGHAATVGAHVVATWARKAAVGHPASTRVHAAATGVHWAS
jgi:hypothetical protein